MPFPEIPHAFPVTSLPVTAQLVPAGRRGELGWAAHPAHRQALVSVSLLGNPKAAHAPGAEGNSAGSRAPQTSGPGGGGTALGSRSRQALPAGRGARVNRVKNQPAPGLGEHTGGAHRMWGGGVKRGGATVRTGPRHPSVSFCILPCRD